MKLLYFCFHLKKIILQLKPTADILLMPFDFYSLHWHLFPYLFSSLSISHFRTVSLPSLPLSAFLPCEVVELKRQNVDINPEYSDSLDAELFTVHLMFEKPTAATAAAAAADGGGGADFGRANSVLAAYASPAQGKSSFEKGLDEVRERTKN
jgi:hypothetical protein